MEASLVVSLASTCLILLRAFNAANLQRSERTSLAHARDVRVYSPRSVQHASRAHATYRSPQRVSRSRSLRRDAKNPRVSNYDRLGRDGAARLLTNWQNDCIQFLTVRVT